MITPLVLLSLASTQVYGTFVTPAGFNAAASASMAAAAAAASQSAINAPINAAKTAGVQTYYSCASASLSASPTATGAPALPTATGQNFFAFDRSVYGAYNGFASNNQAAVNEVGLDGPSDAVSFGNKVSGIVANLQTDSNVLFRSSHFGSDSCQNALLPQAPTCTTANCFCPPKSAYANSSELGAKGYPAPNNYMCNSIDVPTTGSDPSSHQAFDALTGFFVCVDGYTMYATGDSEQSNGNACACISPNMIDGNFNCLRPLDPYLLSVTTTLTLNAASIATPANPRTTTVSTQTITSSAPVATTTTVVPGSATACTPSTLVDFDSSCCPFSIPAPPHNGPVAPVRHLKYHKKMRHGTHYYKRELEVRGAEDYFTATGTTTITATSFYTSSTTAPTPTATNTITSTVITSQIIPFTVTTTTTAPSSAATDCAGTYYIDRRSYSGSCSKSANQDYLSHLSGHVTARCGSFTKKY